MRMCDDDDHEHVHTQNPLYIHCYCCYYCYCCCCYHNACTLLLLLLLSLSPTSALPHLCLASPNRLPHTYSPPTQTHKPTYHTCFSAGGGFQKTPSYFAPITPGLTVAHVIQAGRRSTDHPSVHNKASMCAQQQECMWVQGVCGCNRRGFSAQGNSAQGNSAQGNSACNRKSVRMSTKSCKIRMYVHAARALATNAITNAITTTTTTTSCHTMIEQFDFDQAAMGNCRFAICTMGDANLPHPKLVTHHLPLCTIPAIKVTDQLCIGCPRGPLTVQDGIWLDKESQLFISLWVLVYAIVLACVHLSRCAVLHVHTTHTA